MEYTREQLKTEIAERLIPRTGQIKRKASGALKYDYLVPSGPYNQQWDWDAFFMGMALSSWIPTEANYLRNITLNALVLADEDGFCPGCLKPEGPTKVLKHLKPFTAQGAFLSAEKLGDYSWIEQYYDTFKKIVLYRQKHYWHEEYQLASWWDAMESGADNNVAMLDYKENTVLAPDVNTFIYLEYKAFALISKELGHDAEYDEFMKRAEDIKTAMNKYLWCEEDSAYYTLDTTTGEFIKRMTYASVVPLWAKMLPQDKAEAFIKAYVINPDKLWAEYGVRTLSIDDPSFNQDNIIIPYSNWQGPTWPLANYLHAHGLMCYGFEKEAFEAAERIIEVCIKDIDTTGGMHECYNSETGEPLAAPNFVSWNMLLLNLLGELEEKNHPLAKLL